MSRFSEKQFRIPESSTFKNRHFDDALVFAQRQSLLAVQDSIDLSPLLSVIAEG
jgi:hypothetical protein